MPRINITDRRELKNVKFYSIYRNETLEFEGGRQEDGDGNLTETFFLYGLMDDFTINFNVEYELLEFSRQLSQLLLQTDTIEITLRAFNVNEISVGGDE